MSDKPYPYPWMVPDRKMETIGLGSDLMDQIRAIAKKGDTTPEAVIRTAIENIKPKSSRILKLNDLMGFGKYSHLTVEQVIRCDESYAEWMLNKCESRQFTSICHELFNDLRDSLR